MRIAKLSPQFLIPTDHPRSLVGILKYVPLLVTNAEMKPVMVVPRERHPISKAKREYFVCSGNHRAAAAYICKLSVLARIIETDADIQGLLEGRASRYKTVPDLVAACYQEADGGLYLKGRWEEYLRMITDSSVVTYDERRDNSHC